MPFSSLPASNLFRIPQLQGAPPEIHFGNSIHSYFYFVREKQRLIICSQDDAFGTPSEGNLSNPLTGSLFFLAPSDSPQPAPKYDYDETGVVLEGNFFFGKSLPT